jgi:hypothetical protein
VETEEWQLPFCVGINKGCTGDEIGSMNTQKRTLRYVHKGDIIIIIIIIIITINIIIIIIIWIGRSM